MTDSSPQFNFDQVLSRQATDSLKWDRYKGTDVLPFWVADMDFEIAEPIQRALHDRLQHPIFGYTLAPTSLASTIQSFLLEEYQWAIDTEWLVWAPGVVCALAASCRAYCKAGDRIIVNPPIYHHFFDSHEPGQIIDRVPLRCGNDLRWTWDFDALEEQLKAGHVRLILLCSPHNPTGTVFTSAELKQMMSLADAYDVTVVSDEIHCDLVINPAATHIPTAAAAPEHSLRTVTLMSGSKTWNIAGLNCSFAIIPDAARREAFRSALQSTVPPVPPLAYVATEAAYRDGGPWRAASHEYLWGNYQRIVAVFADIDELTVHPLEATYLAWVDVSALALENTQAFFESHGVGLSGGEQFEQPHYVRINFACPRETLDEGLRRMVKAIESLR